MKLAGRSDLALQTLRALLRALQQQAQVAEAMQQAGSALLQTHQRHRQRPNHHPGAPLPAQLALSLASPHRRSSPTATPPWPWPGLVMRLRVSPSSAPPSAAIPITRYLVPTNLYVCTVARSGQKKTPLERLLVVEPTTGAAPGAGPRQRPRPGEPGGSSAAAARPPTAQPVPLHLQLQDYTGEALAVQLQALEGRGLAVLVRRDELSRALRVTERLPPGSRRRRAAASGALRRPQLRLRCGSPRRTGPSSAAMSRSMAASSRMCSRRW